MARESLDAATAAEMLLDAVNNYGFDYEAFAAAIRKGHRTLQQSACHAMLQTMLRWAEDGDRGSFDGRNEATVQISQAIRAVMAEKNMVYTPSKGGKPVVHMPFI